MPRHFHDPVREIGDEEKPPLDVIYLESTEYQFLGKFWMLLQEQSWRFRQRQWQLLKEDCILPLS